MNRFDGTSTSPATVANAPAAGFDRVAKVSLDITANEAYVADAGNRRVAVIDMNTGAIRRAWGAYGERPAAGEIPLYDPAAAPARQFRNVHCAEPSADGHVYVCDRESNRIQVFRRDGTFLREKIVMPQTRGEGSVWDIALSRDPQQRFLYVADGSNMKVHILDRQSLDVLTSFGRGGRQPGQFFAVHSIATDSHGNLYTTETYEGKRLQKFVFRGIGPITAADQGVIWPRR
jgi:DNA-binding beta-propeller fold protein YncE